jgi:hypothetical protein
MRTPRLARFVIASLVLAWSASLAIAQPAQSASQFYMKFRAAFEKAKAIEDLLPYMAKETKAQIEATPAADRPKMFELVKIMNKLTDVKVVKEERAADGSVTLSVEGIDADKKKNTGKVTIVKEGADWKVGKESWSNSSSVS